MPCIRCCAYFFQSINKQMKSSKSKTLKYPTQSALTNHRLEQILPSFITRSPFTVPPLPKTLDFYRSTQFIWNNPYRSSKKTFRYYHQNNKDNQPRIEQMRRMELTDREKSEQQRIQCVRELRSLEMERMRARRVRRRGLEDRCRGMGSQGFSQGRKTKEQDGKQEGKQDDDTKEDKVDDMDKQIFQLIRSETLKNREADNSRLRRRHQMNTQLMMRSGLKTGWDWTTMRFLESEDKKR